MTVLGIGALAYGLGWSNLLSVDSIAIHGTNQIKLIQSQLEAGGSKLKIGEPLARINPRTEENLIKDLEWIASASVSRNWISGAIDVRVVPRVPIAVFKSQDSAATPRYLAINGVEFSSPQSFSNLAPISLGKGSVNKSVRERRAVAKFVSALPADLVNSLIGIELSNSDEIIMKAKPGKVLLRINWGSGNSSDEIAVKSRVLKGLLALPENKKITAIDLTSANLPIVK
jgi:cell division septal protein FtsQ